MLPCDQAPTASNTSWMFTSLPCQLPGMIAPPYTKIAGTFSRAIAIIAPGMFLSHAATTSSPSMPSAIVTVSMESAITSRLTSDAFIPSVPIEIPSLTVIVPNMNGTAFAAHTPSFTLSARRVRWTLQGVTSEARFPIATNGLLISSSVSPTALSMALAGALCGPSLTALLCHLRFDRVCVAIRKSPCDSVVKGYSAPASWYRRWSLRISVQS